MRCIYVLQLCATMLQRDFDEGKVEDEDEVLRDVHWQGEAWFREVQDSVTVNEDLTEHHHLRRWGLE